MANENKNADVCPFRGIVRHNQIMPQVAKAGFSDKRRVPSAVSKACLRPGANDAFGYRRRVSSATTEGRFC